MKKFVVAILCFIMGCVGLVGCAKEPEPTPTQTVEKKITYYAVIDGDKTSIPAGMYDEDETYPAKFVVGKETTIPDLVEYTENNFKYTFGGWFVDEALNTAFEKIEKTTDSDVSVYAKITKTAVETTPADPGEPTPVSAEIVYKAIIVDTENDNEEEEIAIQPWMWDTDENAKYPLTYVEGVGATVSALVGKTEGYDKYTFIGWYMDKDFTTEFSGTISTSQTGKVTLYAKFEYTDLTPAQDDEGSWTKNY